MEFISGLLKTWLHIAIGSVVFSIALVLFIEATTEYAKYLDRRDERNEREGKK